MTWLVPFECAQYASSEQARAAEPIRMGASGARRAKFLETSAGCLGRFSQLVGVHLRPAGYGGQPSRGLPAVAHANVRKRERRLAVRQGFEPWVQVLARTTV